MNRHLLKPTCVILTLFSDLKDQTLPLGLNREEDSWSWVLSPLYPSPNPNTKMCSPRTCQPFWRRTSHGCEWKLLLLGQEIPRAGSQEIRLQILVLPPTFCMPLDNLLHKVRAQQILALVIFILMNWVGKYSLCLERYSFMGPEYPCTFCRICKKKKIARSWCSFTGPFLRVVFVAKNLEKGSYISP